MYHSWRPLGGTEVKRVYFFLGCKFLSCWLEFWFRDWLPWMTFPWLGLCIVKRETVAACHFLPILSVAAFFLFDSRSFESFVKGSGLLECHDLSSRLVSWQGVTCGKILASFVKLEKESFWMSYRRNILTNRTVI